MSKIEKIQATTAKDAILLYLKESKLAPGWNTNKIFEAWDEISGAENYTLKRFFKEGKLFITVSSSVVCSQLQFRREEIKDKMNTTLQNDPLFIKDNKFVGLVKEIVIK